MKNYGQEFLLRLLEAGGKNSSNDISIAESTALDTSLFMDISMGMANF